MDIDEIEEKLGPWYENYDHWLSEANSYLEAIQKIRSSDPQWPEIQSFYEFMKVRIIFESNLIENAGFSTEGETRKVIEENFPKLPDSFSDFKKTFDDKTTIDQAIGFESFQKSFESIRKSEYKELNLIPSVSHQGKSRKHMEVLLHHFGLEIGLNTAILMRVKNIDFGYAMFLKEKGDQKGYEEAISSWRETYKEEPSFKLPFSKEFICHLHEIIAKGLLPDNAKVNAGEYRIDTRSVGVDVVFPAPELVPASMDKFYQVSNMAIFEHVYFGKKLFETAAKISYDFVRIHPFPDFNGRLSRILMNFVLFSGRSVVPVSIRGDKKGRHRYMQSLQRANRDDLRPLTALIAMQYAMTMGEIDRNLEIAGIPKLRDAHPKS